MTDRRLQDPQEPGRRRLLTALAAAGGAGLTACRAPVLAGATGQPARLPALAPLRATSDRIFDISVCLRPFRAAGPRLDTEQIGATRVVHNYGHGGSGWSLSWGSGRIAVGKALESSPASIAVIGCGALGLTSALLAQSAGTQVTIYAKDLLPDTPSMRATGTFTPDSRIALHDAVDPAFPALWEEMARASLKQFRTYLGLPGDPVRWIDRYVVSDAPTQAAVPAAEEGLRFANYFNRLNDLFPRTEVLDPALTPFDAPSVRRQASLMFNLAAYANTLMSQFREAGGRVVRREFHDPSEFAQLPEKVVINCTGYGARALWRDESVVPVRGQIAWLIPQREFDYGLLYRGVNVVPRSDGICVQAVSGGDMRGYADDNALPDRTEAEASVAALAELYARFGIRALI